MDFLQMLTITPGESHAALGDCYDFHLGPSFGIGYIYIYIYIYSCFKCCNVGYMYVSFCSVFCVLR